MPCYAYQGGICLCFFPIFHQPSIFGWLWVNLFIVSSMLCSEAKTPFQALAAAKGLCCRLMVASWSENLSLGSVWTNSEAMMETQLGSTWINWGSILSSFNHRWFYHWGLIETLPLSWKLIKFLMFFDDFCIVYHMWSPPCRHLGFCEIKRQALNKIQVKHEPTSLSYHCTPQIPSRSLLCWSKIHTTSCHATTDSIWFLPNPLHLAISARRPRMSTMRPESGGSSHKHNPSSPQNAHATPMIRLMERTIL